METFTDADFEYIASLSATYENSKSFEDIAEELLKAYDEVFGTQLEYELV